MQDKREAAPRRYAVTNSDFLEMAAVNCSDDSSAFKFVLLLAFSLSCILASLSIFIPLQSVSLRSNDRIQQASCNSS
jgi:hypothetical protein